MVSDDAFEDVEMGVYGTVRLQLHRLLKGSGGSSRSSQIAHQIVVGSSDGANWTFNSPFSTGRGGDTPELLR